MTGFSTKSSSSSQSRLDLQVSLVGAVGFSVIAWMHLYFWFKKKTHFFWTMSIAVLIETTAFGVLAYAQQNDSDTAVTVSRILLLFAPSLMTISLPIAFDRMMWYVTPSFHRNQTTTWIPKDLIVISFTASQRISVFAQFIGSILMIAAKPQSFTNLSFQPRLFVAGARVLFVAFLIQLLYTTIYTIIAARFLYISRHWKPNTLLTEETTKLSWRRLAWVISITLLLLEVRTLWAVFEFMPHPVVIEFVYQNAGILFIACDALPVFIVSLLFAVNHPGLCLPSVYTKLRFDREAARELEEKTLQTQEWDYAEHAARFGGAGGYEPVVVVGGNSIGNGASGDYLLKNENRL